MNNFLVTNLRRNGLIPQNHQLSKLIRDERDHLNRSIKILKLPKKKLSGPDGFTDECQRIFQRTNNNSTQSLPESRRMLSISLMRTELPNNTKPDKNSIKKRKKDRPLSVMNIGVNYL